MLSKKIIAFLYVIPVLMFIIGLLLLVTDVNVKSSAIYITRRDATHIEDFATQLTQETTNKSRKVDRTECDTIHIAIPVNRTADALPLLKSLLLYRRSPLHLHFIVANGFAGEVVEKLMSTWKLPQLVVSVYDDISSRLSSSSSTSSVEFSAIAKLTLSSILPNQIDRVIFLDNELTVTDNILELWQIAMLEENHLLPIGLGNEDALCSNKPLVALFNLKVIRRVGWGIKRKSGRAISVSEVLAELTNNAASTLLCKASKESAHFKIPCAWNVDLDNTNKCHNSTAVNYKAFYLSNSASDHLQYFKKLKDFIIQYDGSLLSYSPITCQKKSAMSDNSTIEGQEKLLTRALAKGNDKLMCRLLKDQSKQVFRTLMYCYGNPFYRPTSKWETTLVTQLSLDRLRTFSMLVKQWNGPISITMYGTDTDAWKFFEYVSTFNILSKRSNINIHIVFKQGQLYPVNYLRNIALGAVKTPYVFLNDGDFIPVVGLFTYLKQATQQLIKDTKTLLVIPAFETSKFTLKFPTSKEQLLQQIRAKLVSQFCVTCAHKTHAPTNYKAWFRARSPYQIEWAKHFEPYVVVRSDVVRYDERFMGYGYNKVSQITELKAQGYQFLVLPNAFIIHTPHPPTIDKKIWENKGFKACINSIWEDFLAELRKKYGANCLKEKKANPFFIRTNPMHS